jgi:1,4-dihydroxy-6-naphthoate synthase
MSDRPARRVRVACSPDADDLFMMWALTEGHLATPGYTWQVEHYPTDALNRLASLPDDDPEVADLDVLALSVAAWPDNAARWQLLPHGGSVGEGYGPVVIAPSSLPLASLAGRRVAVPGLTTTAWSVLRMMVDAIPVVTPIQPYALTFDRLRAGEVAAALVIHEGRLTFEAEGFVAITEIGQAWADQTGGLPLPLGGNAIRRGLSDAAEISGWLRQAIAIGLERRDEAIDWLLARGGALTSRAALDRYLGMYANARTLDYGADGRAAVQAFVDRGAAVGLWRAAQVDWAP